MGKENGRDVPAQSLLVAVRFDMLLGSVTGMLAGVLLMTVCQVRMVGSLFVLTGSVVFGSLAVMTGGVGMVLGCVLVMLSCFLGHVVTPFYSRCLLGTQSGIIALNKPSTLQQNEFNGQYGVLPKATSQTSRGLSPS